MTQGDPLSPTIFNVVVDKVVRHVVSLEEDKVGDKDGYRREG